MDKFRKFLKQKTPEYELLVQNTDKYLENVLLGEQRMFKAQVAGRLWLACQCKRKICLWQERDSFSAARLVRIIQKSETLQLYMDPNLRAEIEQGLNNEPTDYFLDVSSYKYKLEKRHKTQQVIIMTRIIKV